MVIKPWSSTFQKPSATGVHRLKLNFKPSLFTQCTNFWNLRLFTLKYNSKISAPFLLTVRGGEIIGFNSNVSNLICLKWPNESGKAIRALPLNHKTSNLLASGDALYSNTPLVSNFFSFAFFFRLLHPPSFAEESSDKTEFGENGLSASSFCFFSPSASSSSLSSLLGYFAFLISLRNSCMTPSLVLYNCKFSFKYPFLLTFRFNVPLIIPGLDLYFLFRILCRLRRALI